MSRISGIVVKLGRWLTGFNLSLKLDNIRPKTSESVELEDIQVYTRSIDNGSRHSNDDSNGTNINDSETVSKGIELTDCESDAKFEQGMILVPFRWPVFTIIVSILQLSIFQLTDDPENPNHLQESIFITDSDKRYETWRIFTSIFIHNGQEHLSDNLWHQLIAGCCLELVYGWKKVLSLYLCSAFTADLIESLLESNFYSCGASGAVTGLFAGNIVAIIMNWNDVGKHKTRVFIFGYLLIDVISKPIWYPILVKVINSIIGETLPDDDNSSDSGHIGGAIGGLVFGFFLLKSFRPKPRQKLISYLSKFFATVCLGLIIGNVLSDQVVYWIF